MFEELRALGYRSLLHHSPQVNVPGTSSIAGGEDSSEGLYELYVDSGWVVTFADGNPVRLPWGGGTGAFVDWTHPDAVAHVQGLIPRVTTLGVVGTKMDWDEYLQPNLGPARLHMQFANGETNLTMKSWYSARYHAAIKEGFEQAMGEPSFQLVRHGSPRDQEWSTCVWPGDLDNDFTEHTRGPSERQREWNVGGLPAAIVANQSLGLSGFPCFASDVGGYRNGQPTAEALLRWMAFGVFNAVMQVGGGGRTHMPWSEDTPYPLPEEGWPQGVSSIDGMLDITRRYFRLRMDLFPYIHNELLAAEATGRPLVRSLWSMHPDDPEARRFERDFYFGPNMLVAPVYEQGVRERTLHLPEGEWVDLWTGERHEGPQTIVRAAPLHEIPAFLRDGAIIPLAAPDIDSLLPTTTDGIVSYADRPLTRLWVVPGRAGTLRLFNGLDVRTETDSDRFTVAVRFGPPSPSVDERIRFSPEAVEVRVETGGTTLAEGVSVRLVRDGSGVELDPLGATGEGWTTEQDGRVVVVRVQSDATIEVTPTAR